MRRSVFARKVTRWVLIYGPGTGGPVEHALDLMPPGLEVRRRVRGLAGSRGGQDRIQEPEPRQVGWAPTPYGSRTRAKS